MAGRDYKRIFVLTPDGAGDMVFCLPTLYALKDNLPDARIHLGSSRVQKPLASMLEGKLVDRVVPLDARRTAIGQLTHLIGAVRRFKPDLFLEFDGAFRYAGVGAGSLGLASILAACGVESETSSAPPAGSGGAG